MANYLKNECKFDTKKNRFDTRYMRSIIFVVGIIFSAFVFTGCFNKKNNDSMTSQNNNTIISQDNDQKAEDISTLDEDTSISVKDTNSIAEDASTLVDETSNLDEEANSSGEKFETNNINVDDYIFPYSDSIKLNKGQINSLSKEELAFARNEIYARHGYVFKKEKFKTYFENKPWYKANTKFSDAEFNDVELYNIQLIKKYEETKEATDTSDTDINIATDEATDSSDINNNVNETENDTQSLDINQFLLTDDELKEEFENFLQSEEISDVPTETSTGSNEFLKSQRKILEDLIESDKNKLEDEYTLETLKPSIREEIASCEQQIAIIDEKLSR